MRFSTVLTLMIAGSYALRDDNIQDVELESRCGQDNCAECSPPALERLQDHKVAFFKRNCESVNCVWNGDDDTCVQPKVSAIVTALHDGGDDGRGSSLPMQEDLLVEDVSSIVAAPSDVDIDETESESEAVVTMKETADLDTDGDTVEDVIAAPVDTSDDGRGSRCSQDNCAKCSPPAFESEHLQDHKVAFFKRNCESVNCVWNGEDDTCVQPEGPEVSAIVAALHDGGDDGRGSHPPKQEDLLVEDVVSSPHDSGDDGRGSVPPLQKDLLVETSDDDSAENYIDHTKGCLASLTEMKLCETIALEDDDEVGDTDSGMRCCAKGPKTGKCGSRTSAGCGKEHIEDYIWGHFSSIGLSDEMTNKLRGLPSYQLAHAAGLSTS